MSNQCFWVYILNCSNQTYYTGYTDNLEKRYHQHCSGKGSKYTRSFKPTSIAQSWEIEGDKAKAMYFERKIKKLTKKQKEVLIHHPHLLFIDENSTLI